jgi:antimicrobial peptide system SdpA family protein
MNASSAASEQVRLGRRILTAFTVAGVVVAYTLLAALPAAPFRLPFVGREDVRSVLPEGWAFFTRSPREPELTSYRLGPDGGWRRTTQRSSMSWDSGLGLNRRNRSQGTEVALLIHELTASDWAACDRVPTECLSAAAASRTVANRSNHATLCGEVGLVAQDVLPWAWHDLPTVLPSRVTRVVVSC